MGGRRLLLTGVDENLLARRIPLARQALGLELPGLVFGADNVQSNDWIHRIFSNSTQIDKRYAMVVRFRRGELGRRRFSVSRRPFPPV